MKTKIIYTALAALPIALTPGLVYLLAEGVLNLGGGEKDILLAFPYLLWALIFFAVSLVLIIKNWPLRRWLLRSGLVSLITMLVLGFVLYIASWLGVS